MISISAMGGPSQGKYYSELAKEDYYLKGGEPRGTWFGTGAEGLGLSGCVENRPFENVLLGFSPDGVKKLVQNAGHASRQSGWDLTYLPPKSVSVLWALLGAIRRAHEIQEIHEFAVKMANSYLENNFLYTRRGEKGRIQERVGLVAAMFEHGTSRSKDPLLHTHVLILSASPRADGTAGAILSKPIYNAKRDIDRIYIQTLRQELEKRLHLQTQKTKDGFEISGVPKDVCKFFSKRRETILDIAAKLGARSPQAMRVIARLSRPKKEFTPRKTLFEQWAKLGREHGFGPEQALNLLERARERAEGTPKPADSINEAPPKVTVSKDQRRQEREQPSQRARTIPGDTGSRFQDKGKGKRKESKEADPKKQEGPERGPKREKAAEREEKQNRKPPEREEERKQERASRGRPDILDAATPLEKIFARLRELLGPKFITRPDKLPIFGQTLIRIPFTELEIRKVPSGLFPKAPAWSPLSKLPGLAIARKNLPIRHRPKMFSPPSRVVRLGPFAIELRARLIAPRAKQWSPLYGARSKVLKMSLRPSLEEMKRIREQIAKDFEAKRRHFNPDRERTR